MHALRPRVSIINKGTRKGGQPAAPTPAPAPGPGAAPPPAHNGAAYWIKVAANRDGSFGVTNSRNNFTKNYGVAR